MHSAKDRLNFPYPIKGTCNTFVNGKDCCSKLQKLLFLPLDVFLGARPPVTLNIENA